MYYQLECDEHGMTAYITAETECSEPLIRGRFVDPEGEELPFRFSYRDPTGKPLFDYYSGDELMSKRLVAALEKAGVDNLQVFETVLVDEQTGAVNSDFVTVNIIGLVSCADMAQSEASELGPNYYFRKLVINQEKTGGSLMFRLAESKIDVLVEERVAKAIQAGAFRGVTLTPLKTTPPD